LSGATIDIAEAWRSIEVRSALATMLEDRVEALAGTRVLLKPNLNNDLNALTGNSTDLRVLTALIEVLQDHGADHITIADGPNVGVERRGIDVFRRLRVDRLARRHGVHTLDLNRSPATAISLTDGACPRVADAVRHADLVISVPTVKTHAEAGLSAACKNWVGICHGQDKRQMHLALGPNIAALVSALPPHLVVVDGLVAMEGNGPGDGDPFRLARIFVGDDPWLVDLVVAQTVGVDWRRVSYLVAGLQLGTFTTENAQAIADRVDQVHAAVPPPPRTIQARASEHPRLRWLKRIVQPAMRSRTFARLAYRARVSHRAASRPHRARPRASRLHLVPVLRDGVPHRRPAPRGLAWCHGPPTHPLWRRHAPAGGC
jgi:uncharacterized protein (DUF362 family)